MDRRGISAVVLLVVTVTATYIWWSSGSQEPKRGIIVGKLALDIEVDGLNQTRFVLNEHRGEMVIVEFMTRSLARELLPSRLPPRGPPVCRSLDPP